MLKMTPVQGLPVILDLQAPISFSCPNEPDANPLLVGCGFGKPSFKPQLQPFTSCGTFYTRVHLSEPLFPIS